MFMNLIYGPLFKVLLFLARGVAWEVELFRTPVAEDLAGAGSLGLGRKLDDWPAFGNVSFWTRFTALVNRSFAAVLDVFSCS
jgi:hypothetical protein